MHSELFPGEGILEWVDSLQDKALLPFSQIWEKGLGDEGLRGVIWLQTPYPKSSSAFIKPSPIGFNVKPTF